MSRSTLESFSPANPDSQTAETQRQHRGLQRLVGVVALTGALAGVAAPAMAATEKSKAKPVTLESNGQSKEQGKSALISRATIQKLMAKTGYEGLKKYEDRVEHIGTIDTPQAKVVIGSIDGGLPKGITMEGLAKYYENGEALAAAGGSFQEDVTLAPNVRQKIKYDVLPQSPIENGQKPTDYMIFTPHNIPMEQITAPVSAISNDALTHFSPHLNVSLVRDLGDQHYKNLFDIGANNWSVGIEAAQATVGVRVDPASVQQLNAENVPMTYVTDVNGNQFQTRAQQMNQLALIGKETYNNGATLAVNAHDQHIGYDPYAHLASEMVNPAYANNDVAFHVFNQQQFNSFK